MSQLPTDPSDPKAPFFLNDRLRAAYGADEMPEPGAAPPAGGWAQVQAQLQLPLQLAPVPAIRRAPLLRTAAASFVLGVLLMWSVQPEHFGDRAPTAPSATPTARSATPTARAATPTTRFATPTTRFATPTTRFATPTTPSATPTDRFATLTDRFATPTDRFATPTDRFATPVIPIPAVLAGLVLTETTFAAVPADTARPFRERRRAALLVQRAELARLRWRTDSLLLSLGEAPPSALAATDSLPPSNPLTLPPSRWSVALAFAPERNFFGLTAPATDTLSALRRTHEQGRAGYNASILAEYRVDHRLSVGAGLGLASYGAELRLTEQRTTVTTKLDSMTAVSAHLNTVETHAYILRTVRDSVLTPILDFNNQLIDYQYRPITRLDTVWTHLTNTEVVTTTTTTYTPTITTRQELTARILKPNYRFLTVPLLVRYRLGRATDWTSSPTAPRWWTDVAVGAQLQWFLGGTQAATQDGRTYQTTRVGPNGGPFRPFNVALTTAVAFNYALTPRLSASLAPTLRYQVQSVYKASTNLTQRPTATGVQLGLKLAF